MKRSILLLVHPWGLFCPLQNSPSSDSEWEKPQRSGVNGCWSGCQHDCLCLCALGCSGHLFGLGIAMATGTMSQASPCPNTQTRGILCRQRISQQIIGYKGPNFKCAESISAVFFNMLELTQDNWVAAWWFAICVGWCSISISISILYIYIILYNTVT